MAGAGSSVIRQVAALPYRIDAAGAVSVLLITSRERHRWVVPKGNPIRGLEAHEAAAHEAFEEAGVNGIASPAPLGSYTYFKRRRDGSVRRATVALFPLAVTEQADDWPEQDERDTRWFSLPEAAAAVEENDLGQLIGGFRAPIGGARAPRGWWRALIARWGRSSGKRA